MSPRTLRQLRTIDRNLDAAANLAIVYADMKFIFAAFARYVIAFLVISLVSRVDNDVERTLIIVKPDATKRNITGSIYGLIEERLDLRKVSQKEFNVAPLEILQKHYNEHINREFFDSLLDFMLSGPVVVSIWTGPRGTIDKVRTLVGSTDPKTAEEGTIRKLFGHSRQQNAIHASDSPESASREIELWFSS